MRGLICLLALLSTMSAVLAADPVPDWYMHISTDNFGASGAGYSPGSNVWHCGWDILCPEGTPVKSIADGIVVASSPGGWDDQGRHENYGLLIQHQLATGEKFVVIYGHLKRAWNTPAHRLFTDDEVRGYRVGLTVSEGEVIGKIGAYGTPHLHIAVYFDPDSPGSFPSSGYGRQPLPRPQAADYGGVISYGCWRSPRQWMARGVPFTHSYNDLLPTGSTDNSRVYFIRKDPAGKQQLASVGVDGGEISIHLIIEHPQKVDTLLAGEGQTVYLVSHIGNQYTLQHFDGSRLREVFQQTYSFDLGNWRPDKSYVPILRGLKWEVLDLETGEVQPRESVIGRSASGWASIFFQPEVWRLLGDCIDLQTGHFRPTSWVVDADTQTKRLVAGIPEGDCRGFIVFRTKYETDEGSERVAFGHLTSGSYRLTFARLIPKPDVIREGYSAGNLVVSGIFPPGEDAIPHWTVFDERGEEFALVQVRMIDRWRIFRVNPWGVFKQLTD